MIEKKLKTIIKAYQKLPNAPFVQRHTSGYVKGMLEESGVLYEETDYCILVKPKTLDESKKKLLLLAHLDHPAVVFKNKSQGKFLGLVGTDKIITYLRENNVALKVFSPEGMLLGKAEIDKILPGPKQNLIVSANFDIPVNSIGNFDVINFRQNDSTLEMYNADDGIMVSILLYMFNAGFLGDSLNVYAVFMKHEEVHQVSSWDFASKNHINLGINDFVLNLECLKTVSIDEEKYGKIDYTGGPVLQLSNTGCLFGYKNKGPNLLEQTLRYVAKVANQKLQIGIIKDSCDSRSFTQFALTPNIVSLTIPNMYKHNGADDGPVRSEEIRTEDVLTTIELLHKLTNTDMDAVAIGSIASISESLKEKGVVTEEVFLKQKALLNQRLAIAYKDIIKRGYFYPESLGDHIKDFVYKLVSYLVYLFAKLNLL